jgi:hypothetical protein
VAWVRERPILTEWPRLSVTSVPTFEDRGCYVVSVTDPYGRILGFLDGSHYFLFKVAPQLYSRGWVDPVPDPLLLKKSGSARESNRDLWICSQELWPLDHRDDLQRSIIPITSPNPVSSCWHVKSVSSVCTSVQVLRPSKWGQYICGSRPPISPLVASTDSVHLCRSFGKLIWETWFLTYSEDNRFESQEDLDHH